MPPKGKGSMTEVVSESEVVEVASEAVVLKETLGTVYSPSPQQLVEQVAVNQTSLVELNEKLSEWRGNATAFIQSVVELNNQGRIVLTASQADAAKKLLCE